MALAYPRPSNIGTAMERVGSIGGIELFRMFVDLGATDLKGEEQKLVKEILALVQDDD